MSLGIVNSLHRILRGNGLTGASRVYRIFLPNLKRYWSWFALAYAALFSAILMNLLKPWPLKVIFDYVLLEKPIPRRLAILEPATGHDRHILLVFSCAGIVAIFFLEGLFTFARKYFMGGAGERATNEIRQRVFSHLQRLELRTDRSADFVVRLTSDIDSLKLLLTQHVQTLVSYLFTFAGIGATMLLMDWRLTLLALAVAPPLYIISLYFSVKMSELTRKKRSKESDVASLVQEVMASREVVQAFAREEQESLRFAGESDESMDAALKRMRASKGFGRTVEVVIAFGTALVVYFGATRALGGHLTPGDLIVFITYLKDLYKPVGGLSELMIDFSGSLVCGERVAEMLETEIKVMDAPDAVDAPALKGDVAFEDVTFGYDPGAPVLRDLSFRAKPGEMVALIGSSGTGKSTVINLLLRFHDPWKGRIILDGQDIRHFTLRSLREQISVVLQEPLLFHRTIRENIAYGKPEAGLEKIMDAARAAQAHDFIMQLPGGYETVLSTGGSDLSAGQRQRISLARTILKDAPIFVLDEPATGLDAETEAKLSETMSSLIRDKTTFIIAHRYSTIAAADLILMIEEGRIIEQGTHEELLARSGRYRQIYELQRTE